jgi:hypothetical protein
VHERRKVATIALDVKSYPPRGQGIVACDVMYNVFGFVFLWEI